MTSTEIDPELTRSMSDSLDAYAAGDRRFFDYLADDVRIYNLNAARPMVGRREFEDAFGQGFSASREVSVLDQDVQPHGDQAILCQTMEVSNDGIGFVIRQTVVWDRTEAGWRMSHIHNSQVGQPITRTGVQLANAAEIEVLSERIATAAATVGVAQ